MKNTKKIPLILGAILVFSAFVTYISAQERNPNREEFSEFLSGTFTPSALIEYGPWAAARREVVIGNAEGDMPGSQITFTLVMNRRFVDEVRSFINGSWKFVSNDESEISGIFIGKGVSPNSFSGKFMTNDTLNGTGTYFGAKIMGYFSCELSPLSSYGNLWKYEAWWNGTFLQPEGVCCEVGED